MDLAAVRRWWPLAATVALLFVTALAATRSAPRLSSLDPDSAPESEPPLLPPPSRPADPSQAPQAVRELPDWLGTAALIVVGVVAVVVLGVAVYAIVRDQARRARRKGRRAPQRRAQPRTAEELVAALDAGLEELSDTDRDPRRAVIACWVRLEQAAAAAGTPRHPGDSPTDLVGRLLNEQQVDAAVLAALLDVYRQARYATHTVDDQMRRQARSALERLRADLGAGGAT
jgi:ABC-type transporter Mla MlaB component